MHFVCVISNVFCLRNLLKWEEEQANDFTFYKVALILNKKFVFFRDLFTMILISFTQSVKLIEILKKF